MNFVLGFSGSGCTKGCITRLVSVFPLSGSSANSMGNFVNTETVNIHENVFQKALSSGLYRTISSLVFDEHIKHAQEGAPKSHVSWGARASISPEACTRTGDGKIGFCRRNHVLKRYWKYTHSRLLSMYILYMKQGKTRPNPWHHQKRHLFWRQGGDPCSPKPP